MDGKKKQVLSMEEMDKVSGGVSGLEILDSILTQAGVLPAIIALPRPQAIQAIKEYCEKNDLMEYYRYAQAVYDIH